MSMNWKKIGILTADILLGVYLVLAITAFNRLDDQDAVCREVKINITDDAGKTALIYAVQMGIGDVVKDLLEKGADRNIAGKDGKTALDIAEEKDLAYITMLLKK